MRLLLWAFSSVGLLVGFALEAVYFGTGQSSSLAWAFWTGVLLLAISLIGVVAALIQTVIRSAAGNGTSAGLPYSPDGRPIYVPAGFTSDGRPVIASNVVGYQAYKVETNSLAVVALVLGFTFPVLAIPFGHVARAQIRRTGGRGDGMALAGLILGYLGLASLVIAVVVLVLLAANIQ